MRMTGFRTRLISFWASLLGGPLARGGALKLCEQRAAEVAAAEEAAAGLRAELGQALGGVKEKEARLAAAAASPPGARTPRRTAIIRGVVKTEEPSQVAKKLSQWNERELSEI